MKKLQQLLITVLFGLLCSWILCFGTSVSLPQKDQPTELYANELQDDLKSTFEKAIGEANESVLVIIYSLHDEKIISSLRKKAQEGVKVVVICDPEASAGVEKRLGPKIRTYKRQGKGIMHQKIIVTDRTRVWIGSANLTSQSLHVHGNLVVGFYSPELAEVLHKKGESMIRTGIKKLPAERHFRINEQDVEMWFLPEDREAISRVRNLIKTAKKTIQVAMFTWTRIDLAEEIIKAHKRGVLVEVALDRKSSNGVSEKVAKLLEKEGITVSFNSGAGLLHHKMMIVDDEVLVVGSANWTLAAFTQNNDCFVVISPLNEEQQNKLKNLWKKITRN